MAQQDEMEEEKKQPSAIIGQSEQAPQVTLNDLHVIGLLGRGAHGKVFLVKHIGTDKVYAMKVMRKDKLL